MLFCSADCNTRHVDEEEYPAPLQPMIPRPLTLFLQLRGKTGEWAEKRRGGCTGSRGFHFSKGLWLVLVLLCGARTNAQVYFGHCFSNLEQADGDSNGELTAEEYATFVVAYTDGAMELPLPLAVLEPFQVISSTSGGLVPIAGVKATDQASQVTVIQLCHQVKTALMAHYEVATEWDSCIGALQAADKAQPAGFLGPEEEFAVFITTLSSGSVSSVTPLTKVAYDDMAVDGMIAGPKGGEYLMEFCQRVELAVAIEATKPITATAAPTISPVSLTTAAPTLDPTAGQSEVKETSKIQVAQTNALPQVQFELTEPVFQKCLKDLLLTDINRNDLLERKEYTRFVNRLHNEVFQSDIQDDVVDGIDRAFIDILADQGKRVVPSIYGAKPGQSPNRAEQKILRFVCQTSHEMIRNVHKADTDISVAADEIDRNSGSSEDDSDKFYRTCKVSLFVADRNRDSKVDQDEFADMISRMTPGASDKFRELDDVFQRGFRHASTGGAIKVSGSSPAVQPTLMEISHLQFVCSDIKKSIDDFDKKQEELATSDNLQVRNNSLEEQFPDLSEEFFRTCTMGMFITDEDRDARLSNPEFFNLIKRLSFGDLDASSYADLHPVFKASHDAFSDDRGFIDIVGSKPGVTPNFDEEINLRKICNLLDGAIADVREENLEKEEAEAKLSEIDVVTAPLTSSDSPIDDGTDEDQASEEKPEPEEEEGKSKAKDQQKEEKQNSEEEKSQRESGKKEPNTVTVASGGNASAKNAKAKNAKAKNAKQSKQSNKKTTEASGVSDTFKSLKTPSLPAPPEMSYTMFTKCKKKLAQADTNDDRTLDAEEYFSFASALTSTVITSKSFDRLSETVAAPFHEFAVDGEHIPILGAGIREEPSALEIERLQSFCATTFAALFYYENPVSDEQDCISSILRGDDDLDTWLNEQEYTGFLNTWSKQRYQGYEFSDLPYVLQANYKWSKSFNGLLRVAASKLIDTKRSDIQQLESLCDRLASTVSDRSPSMTTSDHCRKSIASADIDRDGFIEKREFISLISVFTDRLWKPAKRFKAIHPILQQFFETRMNLDEKLDVQSANSGGDALDEFCVSFEEAVDGAQEKLSRLGHCQRSLFLADTDEDMRLSSTEYVDMLYGLIIYPGLLDAKPMGLSFDNLHFDVQTTFRSASSMDGDIALDGFFVPDIPEATKEQLQLFCNEIFDTAVPQVENEEVTVYNSFLLAGVNDTLASEGSSDYLRRMVNRAYQSFVLSRMQTSTVLDTRRKLAMLGPTPSSAKVYDVLETECPISYEQNATCQTFFASYQALTLGENDRIAIANDLSSVAQDAIDDGALQKEMISLDPELPLKVLRASFPLTPSESVALAIKRVEHASMIMRTGNVMILSLSGVFALLFISIGIFYGRRLRKREGIDVANTKLASENLALLSQYHAEDDYSSSDDEEMDGMTKEEKRKIRRERRLRQSIIPLLLGQAYVSLNQQLRHSNFLTHCWFQQHLPDYTYGEDLFQYTYNRHPVLGLLWRHPLHPIGFNVRFVCLAGSMFVGFAVSNIIYITFLAFGWDFDENYFEIAAETIAITGKDSFDNEIMAAAATFTNGNVAIWTVGSTLHAVFDSSLWSMAACTCLAKDGFVDKIDRYSRLGSLAVSTYVIGIAVIAFASAAVRLVWTSENGTADEPSIELAPSLGFVMSVTVEAVIAFFFFYPLFAFMMFSGLLSFLDEDYFGGRRFEMLLVEQREKRELRAQQRKKILEEREKPPELQPAMSRDDYLMYRYPPQGQVPSDQYFNDVQSKDPLANVCDQQPAYDEDSDAPSYLEPSETEEDSSTCREMDFKPRTTGRRHSFGAESVSEREPVRRNWRDDLDTGSVVSAWSKSSKSSWAKYGYGDFDAHESDRRGRSSSRRLSSLEDLPNSVLAMVNKHYARRSMRKYSSSEESEEEDSSWSKSSKGKPSYSKSEHKGSKKGRSPKQSSRRDLVSSASSSSSDEQSSRSSSSNKDMARRTSTKQLKKRSSDESESSSRDDVSLDSRHNSSKGMPSVSVVSSSQSQEASDGDSFDGENRTSSPRKTPIERDDKIRDIHSSKKGNASREYSESKDDNEANSTGHSLSDKGSEETSEGHRKREKKVNDSPDAGEASDGSSNQSQKSFQDKTKSAAAENKVPKKKRREHRVEESDNSAPDASVADEEESISMGRLNEDNGDQLFFISEESFVSDGPVTDASWRRKTPFMKEACSSKASSQKNRGEKDDKNLDRSNSKNKESTSSRCDSAEDDDSSCDGRNIPSAGDATSRDRQQAKSDPKKRNEVGHADDSRGKKKRASTRTKSSPKGGSSKSRVKSTPRDLADSDEGTYAIDDSPLKSSRRRSSWIEDSDEDSSLSGNREKRKSTQTSRWGSDKRRPSGHFRAEDSSTKDPTKTKRRGSGKTKTPTRSRRASALGGIDFDDLNDELPMPRRVSTDKRRDSSRSSPNQRRQSSFIPQGYEQQFSGVGGGHVIRRQSHSSRSPSRRMSAFATQGCRMSPGPSATMGNRRMSDLGVRGRMQPQQGGRIQPGQRRMSGTMNPGMAKGRGFQQARGMQGGQRRMSTMQQPQARQGHVMPQTPRSMSTMQQPQSQQGMPHTPRRMSTMQQPQGGPNTMMQQQGRRMPQTPQRMSPMMRQQQGIGNMMQQQPGQRRMSNMPSPQGGRNNGMMQQGRGMPQGGQRRMSAMQTPSNMMQGQRRMSGFIPQSSMMQQQQPGGARRVSWQQRGGGTQGSRMGNMQGGRGIPNRPGMPQQQNPTMGGGMPGGPRRMSAMTPLGHGGMYAQNNINNTINMNRRMSTGFVGNGMMPPPGRGGRQQNWGQQFGNSNGRMGGPQQGGAPFQRGNNPGGHQFRNPY